MSQRFDPVASGRLNHHGGLDNTRLPDLIGGRRGIEGPGVDVGAGFQHDAECGILAEAKVPRERWGGDGYDVLLAYVELAVLVDVVQILDVRERGSQLAVAVSSVGPVMTAPEMPRALFGAGSSAP